MRRTYLWALALVVVAALSIALLTTFRVPEEGMSEREGLTVVSTFTSLVPDIEQLTEPGDKVIGLTPEGVDPHEYQLTPRDVSLLRSASIIVSTGHAPFEARIRELAERGELKALLIEVPEVPGLVLKRNPVLGTPNYHMPIYDPENYKAFMRYLAVKMGELRPGEKERYLLKYREIAREIDEIARSTPRLNMTAVALTPLIQYAVEWTGIKVKYLLVKEHEAPLTPEDIARIERAAEKGLINLAVTLKLDKVAPASEKLKEIALKYSLKIIEVPSPLEKKTIIKKLQEIANQIKLP